MSDSSEGTGDGDSSRAQIIHDETARAIAIGTFGGFFVGYGAGAFVPQPYAIFVGLVATMIPGAFAIWYTPSARTIALQWEVREIE